MRINLVTAILLVLFALLTGCQRSLDEQDVYEFIDKADNAARKRFAPEICELRGKNFTLHLTFQGENARLEPTELDMDRKLFCKEAGSFSRLRQYKLERTSIDVEVASDRKTAKVTADYVETMPFYDSHGRQPATPDDFREWQVVETHDVSVVGIESGDLVFLSTHSDSTQSLVLKSEITLPYD